MRTCVKCGSQVMVSTALNGPIAKCQKFFGLTIPEAAWTEETCLACDQEWMNLEVLAEKIRTNGKDLT